jgi:aminoglycoside phosphotransferase (APT) family kinase protein
MPALSTEVADLDEVHRGLQSWFTVREPGVVLSAFTVNKASGFSNQTLFCEAHRDGVARQYVLRLPPAGEGLFPHYDLEQQWRLITRLAEHGVPTAAPAEFEGDPSWLGAPFILMPRVSGHVLGDFSYLRKGWLHDATPQTQRAAAEAFTDALVGLHRLEVGPFVDLLSRPTGTGLSAELSWWADYLDWASDGSPVPLLADAFAWARSTLPVHSAPDSVLWNDARWANIVFTDDGAVNAILDWEQATIGPAELDLAFWFATRRQSCDLFRVSEELPGLPTKNETVTLFERSLGRPVEALDWHAIFAMLRMGVCIVGSQRALRRAGQHDHMIMQAPLLPSWTIDAMGTYS